MATNPQIRHLFAQQNPDSDSSTGDNNDGRTFWFVGNRLYSYQTPIAKWHHTSRGRKVVLISSEGYSNITRSKHLGGLRDALRPSNFVTVPYVGENGGKAPYAASMDDAHKGNLAYLVERYEEAKVRETKRRSGPAITDMADRADMVDKYCDWFELKAPRLTVDLDFIAIKREWERRDTPEAKAARKAKRELKKQQDAEQARVLAERTAAQREEWLQGVRRTMAGVPSQPVMFRMKGDSTVQTSMGAEVPLADAKRIFQIVKRCHDTKRALDVSALDPWFLKVGHYHVDRIEASGDFIAGCHVITWPEVERFARQIGVYEIQAAD